MGEAKRRETLGLGAREIDPKAMLRSQAQLYKQDSRFRPDLGMALALLNYLEPLEIGCLAPGKTRDPVWNTSVSGILNFYSKTGDALLPFLPVASEGYFFTIAISNNDEMTEAEVISKLHNFSLAVRIEPKYKYLVQSKKEWVLPLVPVKMA